MRASPQISIVNTTGDTVWTFNFAVPGLNSGTATVTIDGTDIAGNGNSEASNNTFTIDNIKPDVALTYSPDRAVSSADTLTITITATFNDNVGASPQIVIFNGTGDVIQAATDMTGADGDSVWTFSYSVPAGNSGTAAISIDGRDVAGNSNTPATNNNFTIDNIRPTVALTYNPDRAVSSADTLAITANFNEGMSASPQISIVNGTGDTIQAATNMTGSAGDTLWTFNFTVPDGNSGDAVVTIAGTDIAGNSNEAATNNTFTIDNTRPIVALTYNPDRAVSSADTLAITATFNEGMTASPQISIVNGTGDTIQAATNMTGSAGDTLWTFNFTVPDGNSGDAVVTIAGATDEAGNSNQTATNNTFTIDNTQADRRPYLQPRSCREQRRHPGHHRNIQRGYECVTADFHRQLHRRHDPGRHKHDRVGRRQCVDLQLYGARRQQRRRHGDHRRRLGRGRQLQPDCLQQHLPYRQHRARRGNHIQPQP